MSVWTEVTGTIKMSRDSHFSIKKSCLEICDESFIKVEQVKEFQKIDWCFSDDGESAVRSIKKFVEHVKESDKNAYVDIEAKIRFLA